MFIKPLAAHKAFQGHVVAGARDLRRTAALDETLEVLCQSVVNFVSEWRVFVLRDEILDVSHYHGDPLAFPNRDTVRSMLASYSDERIAAFALDVGVLDVGVTALVEVNDAHSLGCYGLRPPLYAQMIEARWLEMLERGSR